MNISRTLRQIVRKEKVKMTHLAKAIGVNRVSLYTSLADDGNPQRRTIEKILNYLKYDLKFIKRKEAKPGKSNHQRKEGERNGS